MKIKYQEWIDAYVEKRKGFVAGYCQSATLEMSEAFPELTRVPGYVEDFGDHWWCETSDGKIIDPTIKQFQDRCIFPIYVKWEPGMETRVGKCMDCGSDIYANVQDLGEKVDRPGGTSFCDERCQKATESYLNGNVFDYGVPSNR